MIARLDGLLSKDRFASDMSAITLVIIILEKKAQIKNMRDRLKWETQNLPSFESMFKEVK